MTETYWIGDLCYVMHDVWPEVCDLVFPGGDSYKENRGAMKLKDGREFVIFSTAHGDGVYEDQFGRAYPVDAGCIGAIRKSDILDTDLWSEGGNLHEFPPEAVMQNSYYDDGTIVIGGTLFIDTDPSYEDEEGPRRVISLIARLREWIEDWIHWVKTGESTLHCEAGHKLYLHSSGYSRVDTYEVFRTEKGRKMLDDMCQLAKDLGIHQSNKTMKDTFEAQYVVEDGYAGPARPKYFQVYAGDLEDDMSEEELKDFYYGMVDEHFKENIYPSAEKVEHFVEWAREKLNERASSEVD